jgi:dephospho-CoA kinase
MVAARRIGLTGGIASGKSSVGRLLAARGLPLLDADVYAREALAPGSPGAGAVLQRYGAGIRALGGEIDRAALGQIVFGDGAERRWLEQLLHPVVRACFKTKLQELAAAQVWQLLLVLVLAQVLA